MAEAKKPIVTAGVDAWQSDKATWEYVSIPEENCLGEKHANIGNNKHTFEAGKTYLIPAAVAFDVKDRLKAYTRSCIRVLQPRRDVKSENEVSVGTASGQTPSFINAAEVQTA